MSSFVVPFELELDRVFAEKLAQFHPLIRCSTMPRAVQTMVVNQRSYPRALKRVKPRRCLDFRTLLTFENGAFPFPLDADVPLYLAPMAGVSESPFRRLCRRLARTSS